MHKLVDTLWLGALHACGQIASFYTGSFLHRFCVGISSGVYTLLRTAFTRLFPIQQNQYNGAVLGFSPLSTPLSTMSTNLSKYI